MKIVKIKKYTVLKQQRVANNNLNEAIKYLKMFLQANNVVFGFVEEKRNTFEIVTHYVSKVKNDTSNKRIFYINNHENRK